MAIHDNLKNLSVEVIDEYLIAAKACLDARKADGGVLGYPAMLLLLCVTDAIGHSLTKKGGDTRLGVLKSPLFGLNNLTDTQLKHLKSWYRNLLTHKAQIAPGVCLTPESQGRPFDFDRTGALTLIRVPVFYDLVKSAWERHKDVFNPSAPDPRGLPDLSAQAPGFVSSLAHASSGIVQPSHLSGKKK